MTPFIVNLLSINNYYNYFNNIGGLLFPDYYHWIIYISWTIVIIIIIVDIFLILFS